MVKRVGVVVLAAVLLMSCSGTRTYGWRTFLDEHTGRYFRCNVAMEWCYEIPAPVQP